MTAQFSAAWSAARMVRHLRLLTIGVISLFIATACSTGAASPSPAGPTRAPSTAPTAAPTVAPTTAPTTAPTEETTEAPSEAPEQPGLDEMTTVRLASWGPPTSDTSFFWVGVEKGFFEEENITLEWIAGNGTADALRHVIAGDADLAWSSADAVMFAGQEGAEVKQVFALWGDIYELVFLPEVCECDITGVADLDGRTVGVQSQSSITRFILIKELADQGLTEDIFAEEINVGFNPAPPLLQGQIDTYTSWPNLTLFLQSLEGMSGLQVAHLDEGGVPDGIVVSDETWESNPGLVHAFTRAFIKSIRYELENQEEVAGFLGDYIPGNTQTPEQLLPQVVNNDVQLFSEGRDEAGLGHLFLEDIDAAQQALLTAEVMHTEIDVDALFTNELTDLYRDYGE